MKKEIKNNHEAPQTIGPYSPALKIGNLVFASGQIPIDPTTGEIIKVSRLPKDAQIEIEAIAYCDE